MSEDPPQVEQTIISYSKEAMHRLGYGDHSASTSLLRQALSLANSIKDPHRRHKFLLICYNNIGCLYKKTGNFEKSLEFLFKAVNLEQYAPEDVLNIANIHLNICAILSQRKEHERALRHALKSVYTLRNNFEADNELIPLLVVGYENLGIEYEYLKLAPDAEDCYRKGHLLALEMLGKHHSLTKKLKGDLEALAGRFEMTPVLFRKAPRKLQGNKTFELSFTPNRHRCHHMNVAASISPKTNSHVKKPLHRVSVQQTRELNATKFPTVNKSLSLEKRKLRNQSTRKANEVALRIQP